MRPSDLRTIPRLIALLTLALLAAGCTVLAAGQGRTPAPATSLPASANSPVVATQATAGLLPPTATNPPPAGGSPIATPAPTSSVRSGSTSEPPVATGNSPASTSGPLTTAPVPGGPQTPATVATAAAATAITPPSTPAVISGTAPAATPGTPILYQDDFTNPASGWPNELVFQDYYVGYHEPDFYHVEVHTPNDNADRRRAGAHLRRLLSRDPGPGLEGQHRPQRRLPLRSGRAARGQPLLRLCHLARARKTWYVLKSSADRQQVLSQGTQDAIHGLQARIPCA